MKSHISLKGILAAIVAVASFLTPLAHAQDGQEVVVNIPFEFSVNGSHLEAGYYKFDLALDRFEMSMVNLKTGKKQFSVVMPLDNSLPTGRGFLIFSRTGGDLHLAEVHFSRSVDYIRLNIPKNSNIRDQNTILKSAWPK
jgi:hypothetical protein